MSESPHADNVKLGSALMAIAMISIPVVDGMAKYLSSDFSPLFISWARYAVASCVILPIAFAKFGVKVFPRSNLGAHFARTVFLVTAMTLYFMSLARIPMATAATAFFISPIFATILAVVVLKESFSYAKLIALLLCVAGMLFIVRPGGGIEPGVLLAIGSGLTFAMYLVATRMASKGNNPIKTLTFQCLVGALLLLPQGLWTWQIPTSDFYVLFAALGIMSVVCHLISIAAFQYAPASVLAPLVYLELVGAVVLGYFVFDDIPEATVWIGAALIVMGGLVVTFYSKSD